jgi:hypothetical protein
MGRRFPAAVERPQHRERGGHLAERLRLVVRHRHERMQRPMALPERQQRPVAQREERPVQRREHRQLVLRRSIAASAFRIASTSSRTWNDVPPTRRCGRWRASSARTYGPRHVGAELPEARKSRHTCRGCSFTPLRRPLALGHRPPALLDEPLDERGDGVGQRLLDAPVDDRPEVAVRRRHRERHHGRLRRDGRPVRRERHVPRLARRRALHARREGRVHRLLDLRHGAEADAQVDQGGARRDELALHALVERHVGAAEAIDRLLRVADQEELPGDGPHPPPVGLARVVGGEQQQDLRLERVRVLELVDEDVRVAPLQVLAHRRVVAHQVAGAEQQIEEVEAAGAALQRLVALDHRPELVAEARREVGAGAVEEVVEGLAQPLAPCEQLVLREARLHAAEPRPLPVEVAAAAHAMQLRLEAVVVALAGDRLPPPHLVHEPGELAEELDEVIVRVARRGERAELAHLLDERVDRRVAREALLVAPGRREVAPLDERPRGAPQKPPRAFAAAVRRRSTRRTASPGAASCSSNQRSNARSRSPSATSRGATSNSGSIPASTGRSRRMSPQKEWIVPMRASSSFGSAASRRSRTSSVVRPPRVLDGLPEPELQLAGGGVGERHRDHLVEPRAAGAEERHHARHQLARLPGARRRLDDERRPEVVPDAVARVLVREARHRKLRRMSSSSVRSRGFRAVRVSSCGPQTGR